MRLRTCLFTVISTVICGHVATCLAQPSSLVADGANLLVAEFEGASRWTAPRHLFTSSHIIVRCDGVKDFTVYVERSRHDLHDAHAARSGAWCGWAHALNQDRSTCVAPVSPFGNAAVGVAPRAAGGVARCTARRTDAVSGFRLAAAALGALLFWHAPSLALSTPFRLTTGSLGFVALSALILLFVLYRAFPHKKRLFAAATLLGSTFLGAMRYLLGTWVPSLRSLATNPLVLAYLALSAVAGLVVTYWFNDTSSVKVNTILRVALQVAGLGAVAASASLPEGAAALAAGLIAARLLSRAPLAWLRNARRIGAGAVPRLVKYPAARRASLTASGRHVRGEGDPGGAASPEARQSSQAAAAHHEDHPRSLSRLAAAAAPPGPQARPPPSTGSGAPQAPPAAEHDAEASSSQAASGGPAESSTHPARSQARSATATSRLASGAAAGGAAPSAVSSPLIPSGKVLNEATGNLIGVGKATYCKLLAEGYILDADRGTITPPPKARGGRGAARGSGAGSGTPFRSSRRAS
ncbi:hypothetical protein ACKKBG_A03850 [Auxenochlorella protothecoides x Auxenochlorella symbiontica]